MCILPNRQLDQPRNQPQWDYTSRDSFLKSEMEEIEEEDDDDDDEKNV